MSREETHYRRVARQNIAVSRRVVIFQAATERVGHDWQSPFQATFNVYGREGQDIRAGR